MKLHEQQTTDRNTSGPNGETPLKVADPTVGEMLDRRIEYARKQVEELCVIKAKCEASGILNFPQRFINDLQPYPF